MAVKVSTCKTFSRIRPDTVCPSIHSFIDFIMYWAFPIVMVNILSVSVARVYERQLCVQVFKIKWIISSSKLLPYSCLHLTTQRQTSEIFAACLSRLLSLPSYSLQICENHFFPTQGGPREPPHGVLTQLSCLPASRGSTSPQWARTEGMDVSTGRTSSRKVLYCSRSTRPVCDWTWEKGEAEMLTFWIWQLEGGAVLSDSTGWQEAAERVMAASLQTWQVLSIWFPHCVPLLTVGHKSNVIELKGEIF